MAFPGCRVATTSPTTANASSAARNIRFGNTPDVPQSPACNAG